MKRKFLFLTLFLFVGMMLFSCKGNDQGDGGDDNPETVYYSVLSDNKLAAVDIVNLVFSYMESNEQTLYVKNMITNKMEFIER